MLNHLVETLAFDGNSVFRAGKLVLQAFFSQYDTRHNINNSNFIRGCYDYFVWTADYAFLRNQIGRIRTAMRFIMREFDTRRRKCVYTTWPGLIPAG